MKAVCKKLFSLLLVAVLLISVVPFQAFAATTYAVYFYQEDAATALGSPIIVAAGSTIAAEGKRGQVPTAPTVADKIFDYWEVLIPGAGGVLNSTDTVFTSSTVINADTYVRARYKAMEYTVTFDANGGTVSPASKKVVVNTALGTLPVPTKAHSSFVGWKIKGTDQWVDATTPMPYKNITLEAQWEQGKYAVSFYAYNGVDALGETIWTKYTAHLQDANTVFSGTVPNINDAAATGTKTGYTATGWMYKNGATFNPNATITADTDVYPKFEANKYEITLDHNWTEGGKDTIYATFNSKVGTLPTPTRPGHVFRGWFSNSDGTGAQLKADTVYGLNYKMTYYARWEAAVQVHLWIYANGKFEAPKLVVTDFFASTERPTDIATEMNILKWYPNADTSKFSGWMRLEEWQDYKDNTGHFPLGQFTAKAGDHLYCMVYDKTVATNPTTGSTTGTQATQPTKTPSDPSNPTTGDTSMIYSSITVMLLAAAALVVVMMLRKKKNV